MRHPLSFTLLAACLLTLLPIEAQTIPGYPPLSAAQPSIHHDFRLVTVADGLEVPWSMAWLPNGDMLVTEKFGRLRVVRDGTLLPDPIPGVPEVYARGQGGLFDVLPHPDFVDNHWIYLSFSKPLGGRDAATAVVRGHLLGDRLTDVEEIFVADHRGANHFGGRMAFDGSGHLFLTLGDRQVPPEGDLEHHPAQDIRNQHGVIVRLNDDGSIPKDNPFHDQTGANQAIYSYGHRNLQGLVIDRQTGVIWETEHGPQGGDELNIIKPGMNYGWPVVGRGVNYGPGAPIHSTITREGMEDPVYFWVPSIATSGLMRYTAERFPKWQGNLFAGGLAGQQLARLTLNAEGNQVVQEETLLSGIGRIRDVRQGPDGLIYIAVEDNTRKPTAIYRLEPVN